MSHRTTSGAVVLLCLAACTGGAPVPCVNMAPPGDLVSRGVLFRVEVFSTEARCNDPGGPGGVPVFSRAFSAGEAIAFDVAAGKRPVVLRVYADAAATDLIGAGCVEADLGAGRKVCLDVDVAPAPDMASPDLAPPDLSPPQLCDEATPASCGVNTCCEGVCRDTTADLAHCGGCRACGNDHVATPSCAGGLCQSTCSPGFGNCVQPAAPSADDGCETDLLTTATSCGGCGRGCATSNTAVLACADSLCTSTCQSNFANCSRPAAPASDDGCETSIASTTTSCGACGRSCSMNHVLAPVCANRVCTSTCMPGYMNCLKPTNPTGDDGCECAGNACCPGSTCQLSHSNGLGQTWFDCVALGTHTLTQAEAARNASTLVAVTDSTLACGDSTPAVCRQTDTTCACWGYMTGTPNAGRVHLNGGADPTPTTCKCPVVGDPTWN